MSASSRPLSCGVVSATLSSQAAQLGDDALQDGQDLVAEFAGLRDTVDLATDQLLNAVYFATSGLQPDPATRQRLVAKLFHGLGAAES